MKSRDSSAEGFDFTIRKMEMYPEYIHNDNIVFINIYGFSKGDIVKHGDYSQKNWP